ncbi:unnamed protein product [Clonostachys rosea f. rosea IK726]|uniref:Uncharacterized protein n=1 Tax=Clonostachys rosea f. rosea IK726 TaxID=1349383 RepID=A0ACA9U5U9_BIOOC|nr:unnamed protein product [Clonostachys rosea f. rosea IK726]
MPLQNLPPEIQCRIFSYLVTNDGPSHIHAVLTTCKRLRDVALPFSVQTFRNTSAPFDPDSSGQVSSTRNIRFLRYILITKPELAKNVKTILVGQFESPSDDEAEGDDASSQHDEDIGHEDESDQDDVARGPTSESGGQNDGQGAERDGRESDDEEEISKIDKEYFTEAELALFKQRIDEALTLETDDDYEEGRALWVRGLQENHTDAQVALILLVCPSIERLYFAEPDSPRNFSRVLKLAGNAQNRQTRPLSNLREAYHESEDDSYGYLLVYEQAIPLFRIPSIRSYECVLANGSDEAGRAFADMPRGSSSVEEITLYKSFCTPLFIQNVFGACKALRSFEFTPAVSHVEDDRMMPRDIMDAILPHANTFENLHINLEDDVDKAWAGPDNRIYMGTDLRRMVALKRLVAGMQSLTGFLDVLPDDIWGDSPPLEVEGAPRLVECIPDNLEHLEIHGCGKAILDQAGELLGVIESGNRFKNLRRVRFLFNGETIDPVEVQLSCNSPNVTLDLVFQSRHNRIYDVGQSVHTEERDASNICSRIFAEDLREQWLQIRGGDVGSATVNQGVYRAPGIDIPLEEGDQEEVIEEEGSDKDNDDEDDD